jgi:peptide subunit release factor RF-3
MAVDNLRIVEESIRHRTIVVISQFDAGKSMLTRHCCFMPTT